MDEPEIGTVEGEVRGPAAVPAAVPVSAPASVRHRAWAAAGILLIALGGLLLAVGLIGVVAGGGGVAFIVLALPPVGAGLLVYRRIGAVRVSALSIALAYAAFALYVATAPLRGLTTADGAPAPGPDLVLIIVGAVFGAAAALLIVGEPASS